MSTRLEFKQRSEHCANTSPINSRALSFALVSVCLAIIGESFQLPGIADHIPSVLRYHTSSIFGPVIYVCLTNIILSTILKADRSVASGIIVSALILGKELLDSEVYGRFDYVDFCGGLGAMGIYAALAKTTFPNSSNKIVSK